MERKRGDWLLFLVFCLILGWGIVFCLGVLVFCFGFGIFCEGYVVSCGFRVDWLGCWFVVVCVVVLWSSGVLDYVWLGGYLCWFLICVSGEGERFCVV